MKILSLNVNGIKAAISKGLIDAVKKEDPDIICLQEIKLAKDFALPFELLNYNRIFNPAKRHGYAGTAIFSKPEVKRNKKSIGFERFDNEGRFILAEFKEFSLINVYMPHGSRDKRFMKYKLEAFDKLIDFLKNYREGNEKIILVGDFNVARSKMDIGTENVREDVTMFTPEERERIERIIAMRFVDLFRKLHPERREFTWFPYYNKTAKERNLGWRIDYAFVTENLLATHRFEIRILKHYDLSDHVPLLIEIEKN